MALILLTAGGVGCGVGQGRGDHRGGVGCRVFLAAEFPGMSPPGAGEVVALMEAGPRSSLTRSFPGSVWLLRGLIQGKGGKAPPDPGGGKLPAGFSRCAQMCLGLRLQTGQGGGRGMNSWKKGKLGGGRETAPTGKAPLRGAPSQTEPGAGSAQIPAKTAPSLMWKTGFGAQD